MVRWTDVGVIKAAQGEGLGTGHHRQFSLVNLAEVAVAVELAAFRIATPKLRELVQSVEWAVKHRVPRLWIDSSGRLQSLGGIHMDPFVTKTRGLFGVALVEIVGDLERRTGESFPQSKGDVGGLLVVGGGRRKKTR